MAIIEHTLPDLLASVKYALGDSGGAYIKRELVLDWANIGIPEIIRETGINRYRTQTVIINADQDVWEPGNNLLQVHYLSIEGQIITEVTVEELVNRGRFDLTEKGQPIHYWKDHNNTTKVVRFYPVPDKSYTVSTSISFFPDPIVSDEDIITKTLPVEYWNDLILFCTYKGHEREKDWTAADRVKAQYDSNLLVRINEADQLDDDYSSILPDPLDLYYTSHIDFFSEI